MWVWVNSGSWWWTGRPEVLQLTGSQRAGHDWATELNWTELKERLMTVLWSSWSSRPPLLLTLGGDCPSPAPHRGLFSQESVTEALCSGDVSHGWELEIKSIYMCWSLNIHQFSSLTELQNPGSQNFCSPACPQEMTPFSMAWLVGSLFPDQGLNPRPSTVQGQSPDHCRELQES